MGSVRTPRSRVLLSVLALLAAPVVLLAGPRSASAAETQGCAYGEGGPSSETVCWLQFPDFQGVSPEEAEAGVVQSQTVDLGGGYVLTFDASVTAGEDGVNGLSTVPLPTWEGAVMGNVHDGEPYYTGLDSERYAFYQTESYDLSGGVYHARDTITLSNLSMTRNGVEVGTGWSMIIADAETTSNFEGFIWRSDQPLEQFLAVQPDGYEPVCSGPSDPTGYQQSGELSGLGTTEVTCRGGNFSDQYGNDPNPDRGALFVQTDAPTEISSTFLNNYSSSRQGVAFGVMFSKVEAVKQVDSRYDADDQFTVDVATGQRDLGSASTEQQVEKATTGEVPVLTSTSGSVITFRETEGNDSTDLDHYSAQWVCTRNGEVIPDEELDFLDEGHSVSTTVAVGEFVRCEVTNTALLGSLSWSKVDADNPEQYLGGSQWTLRGPDGDLTAVDNGESDTDDRAGRIQVNGLTWGDYTLVESSAPGGYLTDPTVRGPYTVDATNLTIGVGDLPNTEAVPGLVLRKIADPASGSLVSPGQTITYTVTAANTGNVDLTPATVTDDLSDVLDDASYVEGSAAARIGEQTVGSPTVADDTLTWSGELGVGETVTLSYQVRVDADVVDTDRLVNVVVGEGLVPPGVTPPVSNCVPGQTNPECTTNHTPSPPSPTTPPSSAPSPSSPSSAPSPSSPTSAPSPSSPTTAPSEPTPPSASVSPSVSVPSGEPTSGGPLADTGGSGFAVVLIGLSAAAAGGLLLRRRS